MTKPLMLGTFVLLAIRLTAFAQYPREAVKTSFTGRTVLRRSRSVRCPFRSQQAGDRNNYE
jgi:hypothetical protein